MDQEQKRKRSGPFWTLNLLSSAAIATATIMYPLDVLRALNMANESLSGFVKSHGIRGMFKQGVAAEIGRASMMRVSSFSSSREYVTRSTERCEAMQPGRESLCGYFLSSS